MIPSILNILLYALLLLFLLKKRRFAKTAHFIIVVWLVSASIGLFYCQSDIYRDGWHEISFQPFFYLFAVFTISIFPFSKQAQTIEKVTSPIGLVKYIMIFLGVLSIIPFVEVSYKLVNLAVSGDFMILGENYDEVARGNSESDLQLSKIGWILISYVRHFKVAALILFFYYLQYEKKNIFILLGLFAASLLPSLANVTVGNRTELIWFVLYFVSLFLLLKKTIISETLVTLKKCMLFGGALLIAMFVALSIGRFAVGNLYNSYGVSDYMIKYTSESIYNFNTFLFHETPMLSGFNTAFPLEQTLGITDVGLENRRHYIQQFQMSPSWLFYSYIGDFYSDYGPLGAALLLSFVSFLFSLVHIGKRIRLSNLMLLGTYLYMIVNGLFYFCYKTSYGPIYANLSIFLILRMIEISSVYKKNSV